MLPRPRNLHYLKRDINYLTSISAATRPDRAQPPRSVLQRDDEEGGAA